MSTVLNVSAYRFVTLNDVDALRDAVEQAARARELKGTVLLANEGINLFLAGAHDALNDMLTWLGRDERLAGLDVKFSESQSVPFAKLKVKVKSEIIRMNQPVVRPDRAPRAPAVTPRTLARWLEQGCDDDGRRLRLLDTRNAFEVDHGRFAGAQHWHLQRFSDFPQAVAAHGQALANDRVVSYCTGGIRCEKAAMVLRDAGVTHAVQLDGGVLRYFEDVGRAHWQGSLFVFDERIALDADLSPQVPGVAASHPENERCALTS